MRKHALPAQATAVLPAVPPAVLFPAPGRKPARGPGPGWPSPVPPPGLCNSRRTEAGTGKEGPRVAPGRCTGRGLARRNPKEV